MASRRARERANSRPWEQQDDTGDWSDGAGEPVGDEKEDDDGNAETA
jgi:hypothetical protein